MAKIEFENKEALNVNSNIPNKNKVLDSDMNSIKNVVNQTILNALLGVWVDTWTSSGVYNIGDIVIYNAILYENLTGTTTSTTPDQDTTNWQVANIILNTKVNPLLIDTTAFIENISANSQTSAYSCSYINSKFSSQTISSAGNDWYKVDLGFCKVYFINKNGVNSMTYNASGWGYAFGVILPTNLTFNSSKMSFCGNVKAADNAVTLVSGINNGNTSVSINYVNHYNSNITCGSSYNLTIIDFS